MFCLISFWLSFVILHWEINIYKYLFCGQMVQDIIVQIKTFSSPLQTFLSLFFCFLFSCLFLFPFFALLMVPWICQRMKANVLSWWRYKGSYHCWSILLPELGLKMKLNLVTMLFIFRDLNFIIYYSLGKATVLLAAGSS